MRRLRTSAPESLSDLDALRRGLVVMRRREYVKTRTIAERRGLAVAPVVVRRQARARVATTLRSVRAHQGPQGARDYVKNVFGRMTLPSKSRHPRALSVLELSHRFDDKEAS